MKVIIGEFNQETNSFCYGTSNRKNFEWGYIYEKNEMIQKLDGNWTVGGMISAIREKGYEPLPSCAYASQSGGPLEHWVVEEFLEKFLADVKAAMPLDLVLLCMHGATQSTEYEDVEGYILEKVREVVGDKTVISVTLDLHGSCTEKMVSAADIICGFQTYPHVDHFNVGRRAALLGMSCVEDEVKPVMVRAMIPMMIPATTYTTNTEPLKSLVDYAHSKVDDGTLRDYTIFCIQPWLDVKKGGSCCLAIANDKETAEKYAVEIAQKFFDMRKEFKEELYSIDEVIDAAENKTTDDFVICVDSADSAGAGAGGDSVQVLQRLIERGTKIKAAVYLNDVPAVEAAYKLGVGKTAVFTLGATRDPILCKPIQLECYVKTLTDGVFRMEGPAWKGSTKNNGPTAVLQHGNIDIICFTSAIANQDPQQYRAFGVEPTIQDFILIKACTSYKAAYTKMTNLIFPCDTKGAASSNLFNFEFKNVPTDKMYPWVELDGYKITEVTYAHKR